MCQKERDREMRYHYVILRSEVVMNVPKVSELTYITFLLAVPKNATCTEAARLCPESLGDPAHDAFNHLLHRQTSDTTSLWREAAPMVQKARGVLVLDDSTMDKPYAREIELVTRHWSGKHHRVVRGINLLTLLWTDGEALIPCDFRVYDKPIGGSTKNEHFRALLTAAKERGFAPEFVRFDSWYASLQNLKFLNRLQWRWLTRLAKNRLVNPTGRGNVPIEGIEIPAWGRRVHLRGYGWIRVFRTVDTDGEAQYWATNELGMTDAQRVALAQQGWGIEVYHRGLKQCCNIERSQVRRKRAQRGHILLSLRAFLRLEVYRLRTGLSWYAAKLQVIRPALRAFLEKPFLPIALPTA
jgi:putative transposase